MEDLTALDLHYLVQEFQILIGAKVDKIYQPKKKEFLFQFHISNNGKKILRIALPNFIYITDFKLVQETPMEYSKFLRKYLNNSILKKICQKDFERILELHFQTKEAILILIIELFSKGNLILCNKEYLIKSPLELQRWASRQIKAKTQYQFPEQKINLLELKENEFFDLIKKTNKDKLVTFLAIDLSLGGNYAEQICLNLKINKNTLPKNLNEKQIKEIFKKLDELINKKIKLNETLNEALTKELIKKTQTTENLEYQTKTNEIKRIIEEQNETIQKFKNQINENTAKAEMIYNNYKLINEILIEINKATKKYSWSEIRDRLKGHRLIKEINLKDKTILVEL